VLEYEERKLVVLEDEEWKLVVEFNDYGGALRVQHVDSVTCALHLRSNAA
jgi:hypothetical protein